MRALVVYESMFGNTRTIAEAVRDGLAAGVATDLVEVGHAPTSLGEDVGLVVLGGPTHAFGMTRESTRRSAADQADAPLVSPGSGIREWLDRLERPGAPVAAATFDTTIRKARFMGTAGGKAERKLRTLGFGLVAPAEHFWVTDTKGPLVGGEVERARAWAAKLASILAPAR